MAHGGDQAASASGSNGQRGGPGGRVGGGKGREGGYRTSSRNTKKKKNPYGTNRDGTASTKQERDAWNRLRKSTGLGGEQLYQSLQPKQDPLAEFYAMLQGGSTGHAASGSTGPTQEEKDAQDLLNKNNTGISDLNDAFSLYIDASGVATDFINKQVADEQSAAVLNGIDYSITDEEKSTRINNYFSDIFTESDYDSLTKLNDDFGQLRLDGDEELSALEFLVTRGVSVESEESKEAVEGPASRGQSTLSAGGGLLDEDVTQSLATLGA